MIDVVMIDGWMSNKNTKFIIIKDESLNSLKGDLLINDF